MKKIALLFLCFVCIQCGNKKAKEHPPLSTKESTTSTTDKQLDGEALFTSKTCVTCHAIDKKIIGPSVKDMVAIYAEKKGDFVQFLKGKADPIVDTTPSQVAIMKANLTGILKDATDAELEALASYMQKVGK
ncbi:c-type cytochrome [Flavobacteriaceae bacterium F08102]|nr:c-type cytochrome [Flavobacteriaceae bacterium F08102]